MDLDDRVKDIFVKFIELQQKVSPIGLFALGTYCAALEYYGIRDGGAIMLVSLTMAQPLKISKPDFIDVEYEILDRYQDL